VAPRRAPDDDVDDELDPTEYDPDPEFYATALEDL